MESEKKDHRRIFERILAGFATVSLVSTGAWGVSKLTQPVFLRLLIHKPARVRLWLVKDCFRVQGSAYREKQHAVTVGSSNHNGQDMAENG